MVPPLVAVALDYHEDPTAFEHLRDPSIALPDGFPRMLADLSAALASGNVGATADQLTRTPEEIEEAARFLIRHVLLDAPKDYYRCLGVPDNASPELIRTHYLLLSRLLHPDRVPNPTEIDLQYARRLNEAYQVLHDSPARRQYDRKLGQRRRNSRPSDPQQFFRRRPRIAPRMRRSADQSLLRMTQAPLRFRFLAGLIMVGATLFVVALWPWTDSRLVQSPADATSGSGRTQAAGVVPDPADDVTAAPTSTSFPYPPAAGEWPYTESAAAAAAGALRPHALAPTPGDAEPRRAADERQRTAWKAMTLPSAGALKPQPEIVKHRLPRLLPPIADAPNQSGASPLSVNAPEAGSDTAPTDPLIVADPPAVSAPAHPAPEMDSSPAATQPFPLIEFESSRDPSPNSQPVYLNP